MKKFQILRKVALPPNVPGNLFLTSMPGRHEPLVDCFAEMIEANLYRIVCLVGRKEIEKKSPGYAEALAREETPARVIEFPIQDYSTPTEADRAWCLIHEIAADLKQGRNMLIHCAGGHGRTGTIAICVLIALGTGPSSGRDIVGRAGGGPDTGEQQTFIDDFVANLPAWPTLDEARRVFGNALAEKCPMRRSRISELDYLRGLVLELRDLPPAILRRFIVPKFDRLIDHTKECYSCHGRSLAMAEQVCDGLLPEDAARYRKLFEDFTAGEDADGCGDFPTAAELRAQVTPYDRRLTI